MNYLIFHRAWLENICCKTSNYILSSSLLHSRKQPQVLHFILWISPVKLSTRFDSEVVTEVVADLMLSISFILHVIIAFIKFRSLLIFTTSFSLGQKRSYTFHYFFQIHSNWPSNSFANSLIMKWKLYFDSLWQTTVISLDTLSFKLQMLCATPIYILV